jgi:Flp pilus assembly protein TadD
MANESDLAAMVMMGRIAVLESRYQEAANYLQRAANGMGNDPTVQRLRGEALAELGRRSLAEDAFNRALAGNVEDAGAHEAFAALLFADGRAKEAREHLVAVGRLDPASFVPAQLMLKYGEP